jgi:hypothetical protein
LPLTLLGTLLVVGVAYAITITVDGVRESAWDGNGSQTPGSQTDPNEIDIDARYNIAEIQWTNDSTGGTAPYGYLYLLVETYANFDANYPPNEPRILFCIDVDNSSGTGATASGYCNDMSGIDRRVYAYLWAQSVLVQRWNGTSWVTVFSPSGGMRSTAWSDLNTDGVADTLYIEIGVDLQSLGIVDSSTCLVAMPTVVYYDNGILDNEDATPNSGTFNLSCGDNPLSPTSITLSNLEVKNTPSSLYLAAIAGLGVILAGAVFVALKRRRA